MGKTVKRSNGRVLACRLRVVKARSRKRAPTMKIEMELDKEAAMSLASKIIRMTK